MRPASDRRNRITSDEGGWYFLTTEGPIGPSETEQEAKFALSEFLVKIQAEIPDVNGNIKLIPLEPKTAR